VSAPNHQNLRGQNLLFRCLETGFVTTASALGRYQRGRGIDPSRRELVGERTANWVKEVPTRTCEHCGMVVKGNQWAFRLRSRPKDSLSLLHAIHLITLVYIRESGNAVNGGINNQQRDQHRHV
jgi:hypothetical protein